MAKPFILVLDTYNQYIDRNQIFAEQLNQKGVPTAHTQKELAKFLTVYNN